MPLFPPWNSKHCVKIINGGHISHSKWSSLEKTVFSAPLSKNPTSGFSDVIFSLKKSLLWLFWYILGLFYVEMSGHSEVVIKKAPSMKLTVENATQSGFKNVSQPRWSKCNGHSHKNERRHSWTIIFKIAQQEH